MHITMINKMTMYLLMYKCTMVCTSHKLKAVVTFFVAIYVN